MLTKSKTHSDTNPVCQRHCIATLSCFILLGLPSPSASQTPLPKGEALAVRKVCCYRQRLSLDKLARMRLREGKPVKKQIPHTGRLRCGGAGMESENVFNRFCHRRRRCGSCHRRCRCTAPDRGRCAPRPPHRWGRGLQWQKPCSGSRCRPCR